MRKVLHKVKSQWVVLGVMGATVVSLGTANVQKVSAAETESTGIIETIEQTGSPTDPNEPITNSTEETSVEDVRVAPTEAVESDLVEGATTGSLISSEETSTATDEITAAGTIDVTAPVVDVSSIRISKTEVTIGETVTVFVNITDDSSITSASVTYVSPITGKKETIALSKNEISGLFEGKFAVTDATELGAWKCSIIEATDMHGNSALLSGSETDLSGAAFIVNEAIENTQKMMQANSVDTLQASVASEDSEEISGLAAASFAAMAVQEQQAVNLAAQGTVTTSVPFDNLSYATDTKAANTAEYARSASGLQWVQVDLGASYDLREIKLWHYFGDGRTYKDVVAQLSNDATFSTGVVTVFNNDRNGSAGLGVGTDSEYSETSAGKLIAFDTITARYARFYSNGSTVNGANHYVEIEVYGVEAQTVPTVNLAPKGTFTSSVPFDNLTYASNTKADNTAEYARGTSGLQWVQADFGASYDINEINLWHYYGDGRNYHDVVVQLSDDATFTNGAVTVFNNDKDGSAGLGVGTDSEYSETSAGKKILFNTITARYARFYSNGSTVNAANHYVEIEVYGAEPQAAPTVNLVPEAALSSSVPFDNSSFATDQLTDNTANYARGTNGLQWMQVDLGAVYDLNEIQLWHYYGDGRIYRDVVVQLSNDATFASGVVTVFNNDTNGSAGLGVGTDSEYSETSAGKTISFDTVSSRYARFYSNGSTVNGANHYVEIKVYGDASTKTEFKTQAVTENVVSYSTIELLDNTLLTGETQLIQAGFDGYDTVTYEVKYTNGAETSRTEIGRETTDVVNEIVRIGTKVVETKTETANENVVTYKIVEQEDDTIPTGEKKVVQKGSDGYDIAAYEVTYTNGFETNRMEISRQTIHPVDEIVKVGTQVMETKTEIDTENVVNASLVEITDSTIPVGERKVIQSGRDGYDKVTYQVTYTNGSETNRTEVGRKTIKALNEIVLVGTQITETKTAVITENEVAYIIEEQPDNTLAAGKREVIQTGSNGFDTVTYAITYTNGLETGRVKLDSVTTAALNEVVRVGTQMVEKKAETVKITNGTTPEIIEIVDSSLLAGERIVIQTGEGGYDLVTYEVIYTNGAETGRTEIDREAIASVNEFVKVGTKLVETKTETVTENVVGYITSVQKDDTLPTGQTQYALIGENGFDTVTYEVTYINGQAASRKEINRVTTAPVNETVRIGTQVIESKTEVLTENESAFTTIELADDTIPAGTREIIQAGSAGYDLVTYEVTYTNGSATGYRELSRETVASVNEIVKVGTQVIETKSEVKNENIIGFTTLVEEDATLSADESTVFQTGANGFDAVTYEVTYTNGVETSRVEVSRQTTAPQNQIVKVGTKISVTNISVTSEDADSIILNGTTLQMTASISPDDATATEVTWSVEGGTGAATIDSAGMLTALSAGTVTVKATANDGSGVVGSQIIEIAVPVAIIGYNGSNLDVVIPELLDGSLAQSSYGYINNYGYTYYSRYNEYDVLGELAYGNKGIVTSVDYYAFAWKQLASVVIPDSVISIGQGAFTSNQLTSLTIPVSLNNIGDSAFSHNQLTSIDIPNSVVSIGSSAFYGNQLNSVNLPDRLVSIGSQAFCNNQLTSIDIPNSVVSIGAEAFSINQLTSVTIPDSVTSIQDGVFSNNQLVSVDIPDGVTSIGAYAFRYNQLVSVGIPDGVTNIGDYAFYENQLVSIDIPNGVASIGAGAFYNNRLISVNMPEGLTNIGESAFGSKYGTNQLTSVTIPSTVTKIGSYAFNNNRLTSIVIPNGVINIAPYAFNGNQLTSVIIPESVTSIGSYAFNGNRLADVTIPYGVTSIGDFAFNGNQITNVAIPNSVKTIGKNAFNANGLKNVDIPDGVTSIGEYAFSSNQLTNVVIPATVKIIGDWAFYANQLREVFVPVGVTRIEDYAFGANRLTKVVIPSSVTSIGNSAFSGNQLTSIVIPKSVTVIGNDSFSYNQFTSIVIPDSVKVIGSNAFMGNQVSCITLGAGVQIGENALTYDNKFRESYKIGGAGTYILTQNGEWIKVEVTKETEQATENMVDYVTKIEEDLTLAADESIIYQAGAAGYDTVTYEVIYSDGSEISRIEVNRQTTSPVNQIIKVGKKVAVTNITVTAAGDKSLILNGDKLQMSATVFPEDANMLSVIWSVENGTGEAMIDRNGLLTATSAGTVKVNATANDGSNIVGSKVIEIAVPLTVVKYNGSDLDVVIPESFDGSQAEYRHGYIEGYGYTNYYTYSSFDLLGSLENGHKGIVTGIDSSAYGWKQLTSVVIPDSVTNIGKYAFTGNQLTSVVIPERVASIGEYAFSSNQLTKVEIPDSVTSVGASAFSSNQLTNIVIPKDVTVIGDNAFSYNQLTSIIIPASVKSIGSMAFYGNQISCITLGEGVQIGDTVLTYDNKFREVYNVGGAGTYVLTQNGEWIKVEATIKTEAFTENIVDYLTIVEEDVSLAADESKISQAGVAGYDTVMYEVIYSEGAEIGRVEVSRYTTAPVKQIIKVGNRVEVTSITVTAAGEKSLILNGDTLQMSAAVLPENSNMLSVIWSVENGTGAATIDKNGLLTAINAGIVTVNATANDGSNFVGSKVIEIAVPLTVINYMGSELDVVIPEIFDGSQAESAYGYIEGRGYVNYHTYNGFGLWGGLEYGLKGIVTSVDNSAFAWKQLTSVVIPDSVTSIGNAAFYYNQLTSVNLPDSLISIGDNAFGYNRLTSIDIPDSVTSIGNSAFYGNQLTDVVIPSNVASIGSGVFSGNQLTSVTIAEGTTSIGAAAFSDNQLTSVTIPDSVTSIGSSSFSKNQLTSIIIPEGVTIIGDSAFSGNQLMSVTIPSSVTEIGSYAFSGNHLLNVVIPEGVTSIGSYAFYDNQLTILEIPDGVTSIGSYAFSANSYWDATNGYGNQLTTVIIPSSVTNIGEYAFSRNKLTSVVIPEGVTNIGAYAFYSNQLTSAVIPTSAASIGDSAFEYNQLTSIVIPEGVITIGNRAFSSNQLTSVDIPTNVTSIGSYAFYNNQLTNVTIPEGVTNIGEYAFYANQLTSVDIPDSVTTIGNNAFEYNRLSSVDISKAVTSIGTQAFNSNQLTSVVIPEGVISIGNNSFSNNLLSSAEIPNTVSIIGTSAFLNNQLTEIVIPDSVTTIGSYAFQKNQLTSIVIPDSVAFIGNSAFNLNQFTAITIGDDVQVGDNLLGTNNNFRTAYTIGGAGTYNGSQDGEWVKIS